MPVVNHNADTICWGYLSDLSLDLEGEGVDWADYEDNLPGPDVASKPTNHPLFTRNIIPPQPKRHKLDIPARTAHEQAKEA